MIVFHLHQTPHRKKENITYSILLFIPGLSKRTKPISFQSHQSKTNRSHLAGEQQIGKQVILCQSKLTILIMFI